MEKRLLTPREDVFVIESFFDPEVCKLHIECAERIGFGEATVNGPSGPIANKGMRNNERVILDDLILAAAIWNQLATFMPTEESYIPDGLNERFRFYRYEPGQQFDWHFDGPWEANGRISKLTFMVYLNEGFEGGETDLFGPSNYLSVKPKEGMVLVFNHNILHRGAPVLSGTKYVLRTDVMTHRRD